MMGRRFTYLLLLLLAGTIGPGLGASAPADGGETPAAASGEDAWSHVLAGDHEHAKEGFARKLARSPGDLRAAIGLAAIERAQGSTDAAARHLLRAAETRRDGLMGAAALVRAMALSPDLRDGGQIARALLEGVVEGSLPVEEPELRAMAALALADTLQRMGLPEESRELLRTRAGRLQPWSMLGAYGKFEGLALSRTLPPERGDLDPSDDPAPLPARAPHRIDTIFSDGRIQIPDGLNRRGAFYAVTDLVVDAPLTARIRIGGSPSMRVWLDGRLALDFDRMRERPPISETFLAEMEPGRHRLLIKIVARPNMSPISVTVLREDGRPAGGALTAEHPRGEVDGRVTIEPASSVLDDAARDALDSEDPAEVVAGAWWLQSRNLTRELGRGLKRAHGRWPSSPLFELWLGEYFMKAETGAAPEEDLAAARGHLEGSVAAAPDLARAHGLLAQIEMGAQHPDRALEHLAEGLRRAPDQPDLLLLRHRIARDRGWNVEAAEVIDRARRIAPGRTDVLEAAISFYRDAGAAGRLDPLLEEQAQRYALADDPPERLMHRGEMEAAVRAWQQVVGHAPGHSYGWVGQVRTLVEAGRYDEALDVLERARAQFPASGWIDRLRAGALAHRGAEPARVKSALEESLDADPSQIDLREALQRRGEPDRLSRWLVDPKEILEQADPPDRSMDAALLADIAVTLVDEHGGQTELYQGVHKVYTRAGVEQEGELEVLPGARIERIRIHKPDGRVVDVAPGSKRPISLPGLEPGDAFEYVSHRYTPPLNEVPGALDNGTIFLFQGEDRDYVLSRFVVMHDESLPVEACVNSEGLTHRDETEDGWRIRSWTARSMPRLQPEPHVADRFDATPHVRLGYGLRWKDVGNAIRDALIGKLRPDPPLPALAEEVRRISGSDDAQALARALHEVVNRRLEPGRRALDLRAPASVAASAGEGNRLGVALALAKQLGLEPALLLARPIETAGRDLDCPTVFGFPYAMLLLPLSDGVVYLDYNGADHAYDTIPLQIAGSTGLRVPVDPARPVEIVDVPRREPPLLQDQWAEVTLDGEGRVSGQLTIELDGPLASSTRRMLTEIPKARMPQIEQGIASQVFPGARVESFEVKGMDDPESPLRLEVAFEDGSLARRTPSGFAIPLARRPLGLFDEFGSLPARRFAMLFSAQSLRRDRLTVELPEGLEASSVPDPVTVDSPFGRYRLEASASDGKITIERLAKIPPQRIEPPEYPEFRSLVRTIDQAERAELRLTVESPAMAP
jgi:tetratricopeptide (TPR) repeat protein